jgi:hypothetical protein
VPSKEEIIILIRGVCLSNKLDSGFFFIDISKALLRLRNKFSAVQVHSCRYEGMSPNQRLPFMNIQGVLVYGDSLRQWIDSSELSAEEQALLLAVHRKCIPAVEYTLVGDWKNFRKAVWPVWKHDTVFPINYMVAYGKRKDHMTSFAYIDTTQVRRRL